jgi:Family of unknown function (DUF6171)
MNSDYDDIPDYIKIGLENAKKVELVPAPPPPVYKPKVPFKNKVRNLFNSIKNIAIDTSNGKEIMVTNDVYNKRFETCMNCSFLSDDKNTCTQCGCIVALKAKFQSSECPKHYW